MAHSTQDDSPSLGEWMLAVLLALNLVWTTLCLGGYRAESMVLGWSLTAALLILHFGMVAWEGSRPHPAGWWLLPFLGYALINALFISPVPWLAWTDWLGWLQTIAIFWVVLNGLKASGPRQLVAMVIIGLGVVAVMLAAYQRFVFPSWLTMGRTQADQFLGRASGPFGIPNSLAAFMLLLIPPMLALAWQRGAGAVQRVLCGYLAVVFLFGLGLTISRGAWISFVLALVGWPLFLKNKALEVRITWSVVAFTVAIGSGLAAYSMVPQIKNRFDMLAHDSGERSRPIMWAAAWDLFLEEPLQGTGAGSYNVLFERYRPEKFVDEPQWAHNDYLNTLSDYGMLGFGLLLGGAGVIASRKSPRSADGNNRFYGEIYRGWRTPDMTYAIAVGLMAFALSAFVDFHQKIPALAMLVAATAAELVRRAQPLQDAKPLTMGGQAVGGLMALATLVFLLGGVVPVYQSEAARSEARARIDRMAINPPRDATVIKGILTEVSVGLAEAVAVNSGNAQAWADRSYALSLWGRLAPLRMNDYGRDAEQYARQALSSSKVVPEFWIRLGVSLDMQGKWAEASQAFAQAISLAPASPQVWYYQAYHLALNPVAKPLALASIETCLRLDPSYRTGLAFYQELKFPQQ